MIETDLFETGRKHFDSAEFFEAHEVWEDLWNETVGPRHHFIQCLIQVAVALHHARNENWVGARKLLASCLVHMEKGRTESEPVDLEKLRDYVLEVELAIQELISGTERALPFFSLPLK